MVIVTKYRHPVIKDELRTRLMEITNQTFAKWKCSVLDMESDMDYLHIYFEAPPQVRLSDFICNYKTVSARLIRKEFASFLTPYYWKPYFWSRSYFISSVSEVNDETIHNYIDNQSQKEFRSSPTARPWTA